MISFNLSAQTVFQIDFEHLPTGTYDYNQFKSDWLYPEWQTGITHGRVHIRNVDQSRVLEVFYPANTYSAGSTGSGAQWPFRLGASYEELYLQYRVKFKPGFEWRLGGKLPGLIGGYTNSGGVVSGGYVPDGTDGWSARLMWHAEGKIFAYLYYPDMSGQYGENIFLQHANGTDFVLQDDTWYTITERVRMNTPGQRDGILQIWLNGELVLDRQDIRYRDVSQLAIDGMYFSTFYGGGTPDWAPFFDNWAYFDDFVISTIPISAQGNTLQIEPVSEQVMMEATQLAVPIKANSGFSHISFSLLQAPAFAQLQQTSDSTAGLYVAPDSLQSGLYTIQVEAAAEGQLDTLTFSLRVLDLHPSGILYRINAGGTAFSLNGISWQADQFYTGSTNTVSVTDEIAGTQHDAMYQSERYGEDFAYHFPLPPGTYHAILHFSEVYYSAAGGRSQEVWAEDSLPLLQNYDIYASKGSYAADARLISNLEVNDGALDLRFLSNWGGAKICGIEIFRFAPVNAAPAFTHGGDISVVENFSNVQLFTPVPISPPPGEQQQSVTYSLSPQAVGFALLSFDPGSGQVVFASLPGQTGSQEFTLRADDGQTFNNEFSATFRFTVYPASAGGPGGGLLHRINAGGSAYTTSGGIAFEADQYYSTPSENWATTAAILGTQEIPLYQSGREGSSFNYQFEVANGLYDLVLHFAEHSEQAAGRRVFDVSIEGQNVLQQFDIFAQAGQNRALKRTFENIAVTDGNIQLAFQASVGLATVSAIEVINQEATFPIELTAFEAWPEPQKGWVRLKWETGFEYDNHFFTVERAVDGQIFEPILQIPSQGNSNQPQQYAARDLNPAAGTNYYRLKQTDLNGAFSYSDVTQINFEQSQAGFLHVYPQSLARPASFRLEFGLPAEETVMLSLVNLAGQLLWQREVLPQTGLNTAEISSAALPRGRYYLYLQHGESQLVKKVEVK